MVTSTRTKAETAALKSSPFASRFVGTDTVQNLQSMLNHARDNVPNKISDTLSTLWQNSARKVKDAFNPRMDRVNPFCKSWLQHYPSHHL